MSAAAPKNVVRFLEWDTQFFGVRIASLEAQGISAEQWHTALAFCREQRIGCLYVLASSGSDHEHPLRAGAKQTDLRVTLERRPPFGRSESSRIRLALESDIPALRAIAARSHTDSRFYADGGFARDRCDELYATWIEKSVRGWADSVFTSGEPGAPQCYLSYHEREEHSEIGLVAVAEEARGQGLGRALVEAALIRAAPGLKPVHVVTQGRNEGATALYEKCGFELLTVQSRFHLWFP